jgi:hypothetical protein
MTNAVCSLKPDSQYCLKPALIQATLCCSLNFRSRGEGPRSLCRLRRMPLLGDPGQQQLQGSQYRPAGTPHPPAIGCAVADLDEGLSPFSSPFDYIICADVLEHFRSPSRLLGQCRALWVSGGILLGSL